MQIVRRGLVEPFQLPGLGVEREDGVGVQIPPLALIAVIVT